ncbi:hypothetical protein HY988_00715 [Candidatus Micrarchaeota archaeon]|nr:hypothetical protein [Candidatus Micrarchaeota archaeon]
MRAFIFSLDSFVAFTLALIAIYSLIFFSSIPSSYYYLLTQAHYLSKDVLISLSSSVCDQYTQPSYGCTGYDKETKNSISLLDDLASNDLGNPNNANKNMIKNTIGVLIPPQYGYRVELSGDGGKTWATLYDTSSAEAINDQYESHAKSSRKLSVSSQVVTFGSGKSTKPPASKYSYNSCNGGYGLLTCGNSVNDNLKNPEVVPSLNPRVVKLTIFI